MSAACNMFGSPVVGDDISVDLGTGTIRVGFQSVGNVPFLEERLNSEVKLGVTEVMITSSSVQKYSRGKRQGQV